MKNLLSLLAIVIFSVSLKAQTINVFGKNIRIPNGATATTRNNNTQLGEQIVATGGITRTFSITNTDAFPLTISSITSTSTEFTIGTFPSTVASGSSITFSVTFNPSATGVRTASITITNDDFFNPTYIFRVTGDGLTSRTARWVNNAGATRPTSITLNGDSYSVTPTTYTNVQDAVNVAGSNDIIYVTNGRYKNPDEPSSANCQYIALNNPDNALRINVYSASGLIITSQTGDYQTSSARLVGYAFNFWNSSTSNITIQGLTLDSVRQNAFYNTNAPTSAGATDIRILRNKITNVRGAGVKTDSWGGDRISRGMWEINGNYFENIGYYQSGICTGTVNSSAVWLGDASVSFEISDNTIINTAWAGILCDGFGHPTAASSASAAVTIQRNKIYNTRDAGIQIGYSSANNTTVVPTNAFINQNYLENVNTSSSTAVGAITMRQSNLRGVSITHNQITGSWNGIVLNIPGILSKTDSVDCRFNNLCNIKAGSYGFAHQAGVAPNLLNNFSENARLNKIQYNYWGSSTGPTYSANPSGTGATLFKSATTTTSGALYSLNNFSFAPFRTTPNVISIMVPGTIQGSINPCSGASYVYSVAPVAGALSYTWALPSGWTGSSTTNTISVITSTNSGNIVVTTSNTCGTPAASTLSVTIGGATPPAPLTISGSTAICSGSNNNYSIAAVSGATAYVWTIPGTWSGSSTTTLIATTASSLSGNITVAASNSCGSGPSSSLAITINAFPTITVGNGTICTGESFTITPSGASTYTIYGGSSIVSPTITTSYSVTGTNSAGCIGTNTAVSTVSVNVSPTVTVNSGSICSGKVFTMTPGGASTYTFSSGSATVAPTGNTSYNVTGTGTNGCVSSNTAVSNVTVGASPTIAVNSGGLCTGNSFTITPSGANTYTISGGSSIVSPTIATSYSVTGTGTNGCIGTNTAIASVSINATPTITVNSGSICSGSSFTIIPGGADTYTISGGSSIVSPTATTSYSVTGTGTNGCISSNTAISMVSINASPTITVNSGSICLGNSFTITPGGASTYTISGGSSIVSPTTTTSYTVTGTGTNGCIGSNTAISTVSINASPTITVNSGGICSGTSFTITPSGASTYTISGGSSIVSPTTTTSYSVTGTGTNGCVATNTAVASVSINATPTISVNSGGICSGNSFTIIPAGASTYTISGGSSIVSPTATTSYSVTGTGTNGCISSNTAVSAVSINPSPTITVNSGGICIGNSFTITPGGASTYTFSGGSAIVSPTINTSYSVTGTGTNGCIGSNTAVSNVSINPSPTISVNSGSICSGTSFTIVPSGAGTYTITGGSSIVSPTVNTSYTVTGRGTNGCVSSNTAISTITVVDSPSITATSGTICSGNSFTIDLTGAGTYTISGGSTIVSPAVTTTYSVTGTGTNGCVSSNTAISTVSVNASPTITVNSGSICSGNSFTITPSGASTYTYSGGSSIVSPTTNTSFSVNGTGTNGCVSSNTAISNVTVNASPTISVNSGSICSGNSFTMVPSGASTYTFSNGSAVATPTANISYSVTGTSSLGCIGTNTAVSSVIINLTPTLTVNSGSICSGNSFTISPSGASTYTISGGSAIVSPSVSTNYTITATSAQGCTASLATSTVTVNNTPTISVNSGSICSGQSFTLSPSGAFTYTVSGGLTVVSPTISTSYSVTGTSAQGCVASNTAVSSVVVNTVPIISVNSGSICNGKSFTLTPSGAASYTYQGGSAIVSPTTTSSFTVSGTSPQGCVSATTAVSNITVFALPTLSLIGGSICPGNNFTLNPSGAATYTYLNGGPVITPTITTTYSVTGTSSVGCPGANTITAVVTVTNTLVVTITGSTTICSGNAATLTANGASTYSWTNGITTATVALSPTVNTTYTVYGVSGTCSNNAVVSVSVNTTPTITIAGTNTLCSGNSISLTASGANSYSWSTGASTSSISVSPTVTITYSVVGTSTNTCFSSASQAISVFSVPVITVNSGSICSGNSFTINPSGANTYTYSGGSSIITPILTTNYTIMGTSAQGCTAVPVISTVTVNSTPTLAINSGSICSGQSFTLSPSGASTYTITGGLTVVSPTITTSYSITGTSAQGCVASNTAVSSVVVNTVPIISVNSGSICNGTSFTLIPSGAASYTYQGGSAIVSPTTTSTFTVSGTSPQGCVSGTTAVSNITVFALPTLSLSGGSICPGNNFTLSPSGAATYTYLNGGPVITPSVTGTYSVIGSSSVGCPGANTITAVVTVTNTLLVTVSGATTICSGQTATLTANGAATYSWTNGITTATVALSPTVNTTYTVYGVSGTCSNNAVVSVSVNTTPTVTIAGSNTLCSGTSISLTASGANSYSWSTSATTSSISVSPTVTTTYSVVGTSTNGCFASTNQAVSVFSVPVLVVNSGSICSGNSFTINPSGANTYTYSGGSAIISPSATTNYTVTGTSAQGCTAVPVVSTVTVNTTPTIAINSGSICTGQSFTLSPSGASTYTVSGGLTVVSPTISTSYSVTGTSAQGCVASNTAVSSVVVNTVPIISVNSGSICNGTSFTIAPSGAASYTYQGGSAVVSPSTTSSFTVSGTSSQGCVSATTAISTITVFALPTLSLSGGSICPGNSFTLNPSGAATYTYLNGGPVIIPTITTTYSVSGTSSVGCPGTNTITAVVTVTNTLAVGITGSTTICSGQTATLTANGAATYSWTNGITTATVALSPTVNTTYTVFGVSGTCSNNAVVSVSVNTTPTVNIAGSNTLCSGTSISLTASGANSYSWSTSAVTASISVSPTTGITYSVIGTSTNSCFASASLAISVFSVPVITVNSGSICSGNSFTINPSGANTYTYSGGSSIITPSLTTNYTVTGTSAQGCTAVPVISTVTVNTTPTLAINSGSICSGQSFTLSPSGASTYTITGGLTIVSPTTNTSYSVTATSAQGCVASNTAVSSVVVNTVPIISVNSGTICNGTSFSITSSGAASYTYQGGNAIVSPTTTSSFTVSGTSPQGCVSGTTAVSNITVFALPTLSLSGGSICPGNNFTLSPSGAATYTYLNGGPVITPSVTGTYSVIGTSSVGCPGANTITAVVTVTNTLAVSITGSTTICSGQAATLTANGAATYSWTNGITTATVALSPTVNTTYTVFGLSGTCSNNAVVSVSVNTTPTVTIAGSNTLCSGTSISLTASGANSYSWSTNAATASISVSPTTGITYSVVGTSTNTCFSFASQALSVFSVPVITVNSGSICSGNAFTISPSGASTYTYSGGSAIVSPSVTNSYSVTGTSTAGCISTITAVSSVTVNATPTIAVANGTICAGDTFTLNPSGAATYVYSSGSATVSPSSNTSYSITGTSSVGCVSSNTAVSAIAVNTLPIIVVNSGSICSGNSFTIAPSGAISYTVSGGSFVVSPTTSTNYVVTGTGANGCVNLVGFVSQLTVNALPTLSLSGGSICPGNSFTLSPTGAATFTYLNGGPIVTPAVTTSYSVTGTSAVGCAATNTVVAVVTVTNTLALSITGSTVICSGQSATLTGTGATTYSWSNGPTTTTVSLNPLTNTTYTLFGVSGICSNNLVVTVSVNITPTISIAGSNTVCSGSQLSYTANGATTYLWNTTATTAVISNSPLVNTNYSVTGTSTNGCFNSAVVSATVLALPILTVNSGSICTGQVFTLTPSGASTYTYSNGTSTTSPIINTIYTVTGTSTAGCIGSPVTSSVEVNISPTVIVNSGSICAGQSFVIVPNGAASYVYSGGSATVSPAITTVYSVTGISSLGCASSNTALSTVSVIANPILTVTASSPSLCIGNSSTLTVSGAENYTWTVNGSNSNSIIVTPTSVTNYTVLGTSTSDCPNSATVTVNLFASPVLTVTSTNTSVCAGFSTALTATGASSYTWNTGSTNSGIFVSPTVTSIYSVTGTDQNSCVASSTIAVALIPVPSVSIVASAPGVCLGSSANLTAIGASSYTWNTDALTPTVSVSPNITTLYTVIGTSGAGCFASATATVLVYPSPTVNIGNGVEIVIGKDWQFTATQSLAVTYTWSPVDYLNSTSILNPIATPYGDITYTLLVSSANGCNAKDTVNVKVLTKLIIANYMSPNNDGKNDYWKINLPALIKNYSVLIIDSYNQTVYTKADNYTNEFDGKRNGDVLPDGVYYYFIKDGNSVKYKGSITLTK
jgi:gliding motility-associated-like protein